MLNRHLTTRSKSLLAIPSSERPGDEVKPWATNWELMYCRLEVETIESEEAVEKGEPKSDMDTSSSAQCTSFLGVTAMVDDRREIERYDILFNLL